MSIDLRCDRSAWQYPQWASCAQEESSAIGAALLLGQWWQAAQLLADARSLHPHRASWTAWLSEIPVSESHACRLVRIAEAGHATPTHSFRAALRLTPKKWSAQNRLQPEPAQSQDAF